MNLFLIVYEHEESCDWFFATSKDYPDDKEVKKLIAENYDIDMGEFNLYITNYWINEVDKVNNYKVKLVKE